MKSEKLMEFLSAFTRRRIPKTGFLLACLIILPLVVLIEFFVLGLARKTFVFYAIDDGAVSVEERALRISRGSPRSQSRELDITRYVEEALLGPVSPNSLPLFPRETRLRSLLYRNGVVYVDLSEDAALPPLEGSPYHGASLHGGEVFTNMKTLYYGIRRNFPYVRDMRFFIAGRAAYAAEFRQAGELAGSRRRW